MKIEMTYWPGWSPEDAANDLRTEKQPETIKISQ